MAVNSDVKKQLVLVHGLAGNPGEFKRLKSTLGNRNYTFHEFTYQHKYGQAGMQELARELKEFCNSVPGAFDIVAISMGGIIATTYLQMEGAKRVGKLITICTPHHGSLMAYLLPLPGVRDLRPRSSVLANSAAFLRRSRTRVYAVYSPFDLTVFPGWRAKAPAGVSRRVYAPMHRMVTNWPSTQEFIKASLATHTKSDR